MKSDISNETLEKLAQTHIRDIKSRRKWKFFTRAIIIIIILLMFVPGFFSTSKEFSPHIGLVKVEGVIAADSQVNAQRINESLDKAFDNNKTKAVVIEINSPGGSPVQSDDIYEHMQYLHNKYPKVPLYAVCNDVCASGGYYIATGAKEIYTNKMTITGSIGVIGSGFGFTGLIEKLGIERRTYTSGKNKNFLDPFVAQKPEQKEQFEKLLNETHQVFVKAVEDSRGDRLKDKSMATTFSGEPFSGIEAKKIGLIDGFASVEKLKREKLDDLDVVDYTQSADFFTSLFQKLGNTVYYKALSENTFSLK